MVKAYRKAAVVIRALPGWLSLHLQSHTWCIRVSYAVIMGHVSRMLSKASVSKEDYHTAQAAGCMKKLGKLQHPVKLE